MGNATEAVTRAMERGDNPDFDDVRELLADNARLRAPIKQAEDGYCQWCGKGWRRQGLLHAADCPAFTPEGKVK